MLDDSGFQSRRWQDIFLFSKFFGPALGPIQPPVRWYRGSYPEVKRSGRDVDQSHPSSAETKNEWSYTSTPPICLHGVGRGNFTLIFIIF